MDLFNSGEIDKNIFISIKNLTILSEICKDYIVNPSDNNGEKIIEKIEEISKNYVAIKENIATMVNVITE